MVNFKQIQKKELLLITSYNKQASSLDIHRHVSALCKMALATATLNLIT